MKTTEDMKTEDNKEIETPKETEMNMELKISTHLKNWKSQQEKDYVKGRIWGLEDEAEEVKHSICQSDNIFKILQTEYETQWKGQV